MAKTVPFAKDSDAAAAAPMVRCLSSMDAGARWGEIGPILVRAMAIGPAYWTIDDLWAEVLTEHVTIWTAHEDDGRVAMAMAVRLVQRHRMKICFIELLAAGEPGMGAFARFYPLALDPLIDWAKSNGCNVIEATGLPRFAHLSEWRSCATIWKEI